MAMKQPSLGTPQLRAPSLEDKPAETAPAAAPLPAYAPSFSKSDAPAFSLNLSPGKLKDPTEGMSMAITPTSASTAPKESFLLRNVGGLNMPVWQVALGGLGVLAIGAGLISLFSGGGSSPRRALRGHR